MGPWKLQRPHRPCSRRLSPLQGAAKSPVRYGDHSPHMYTQRESAKVRALLEQVRTAEEEHTESVRVTAAAPALGVRSPHGLTRKQNLKYRQLLWRAWAAERAARHEEATDSPDSPNPPCVPSPPHAP